MYFIAKRLKKRHGLNDDVRSSLYEAIDSWVICIFPFIVHEFTISCLVASNWRPTLLWRIDAKCRGRYHVWCTPIHRWSRHFSRHSTLYQHRTLVQSHGPPSR